MTRKYRVLCCFDLKPIKFYLFVNIIDLLYNNFNLTPTKHQHSYKNEELFLCRLANSINWFMTLFGLWALFLYLYKDCFDTLIHKTYISFRLIICQIRLAVFLLSFLMSLYILFYGYLGSLDSINAVITLIVIFIEINNIRWSYWVKEIIYQNPSGQEELYWRGFNEQPVGDNDIEQRIR